MLSAGAQCSKALYTRPRRTSNGTMRSSVGSCGSALILSRSGCHRVKMSESPHGVAHCTTEASDT